MKMTLDELKVDSYATEVSERELTEVKGGSGWVCTAVGIAASIIIAIVDGGGDSDTPDTPDTPDPPSTNN